MSQVFSTSFRTFGMNVLTISTSLVLAGLFLQGLNAVTEVFIEKKPENKN